MKDKKKKVLIVSYNFPPMGGSGVVRVAKFCKYLPIFNWLPIALTVKEHDIPLNDETFLKGLNSTKIVRTNTVDLALFYNKSVKERKKKKQRIINCNFEKKSATLDLFKRIIHNFIFVPDSRIGWLPFAVYKALQIRRSEGFDLIFSTGGPWTNHLIGLFLKAITDVPWVADFRDPWTENDLFPYSLWARKYIEERMEKAVVCKADKIIATTDPIGNVLKAKYCQKSTNKFHTITNGYDAEDFQNDYTNFGSNNGKLTITYTGNFYSLQTPNFFLEALSLLLKEIPTLKENIEVIFAGHWENWDQKTIQALNLEKVLKYIGFISQPQALALLSRCDVALLILAKELKGFYTSKIFDYFAANKPILALVPKESIAAKLIKRTRTGVAVDPENVHQIRDKILGIYKQFKYGGIKHNPDLSAIRKFDRKNLTEDLSHIFNQTIQHNARNIRVTQ